MYVDKTAYIARMAQEGKYFFLSRPRRFGKSLLLSTMEAMFLGRKALFTGTAVEKDWDWTPHPVLRIDFTGISHDSPDSLKAALNERLAKFARTFDCPESGGWAAVLEAIHAKTGKRTVVLVDEYDKPITDYIDKPEMAEANREVLRQWFGALKGAGEHLRFFFLTGVSKFAKISIFSELNNLIDLTLLPDYNAVCGFTEAEIEHYLTTHIDAMAQQTGMTSAQLRTHMRELYNGYSWNGTERVYNPYSLLQALYRRTLESHWYASGTATFLIKEIRRRELFPLDWNRLQMTAQGLDLADVRQLPLEALLFQTGYLTIRRLEFGVGANTYTLDFPNAEVRRAFFSDMLENYTGHTTGKSQPDAQDLRRYLMVGDVDGAGAILRRYVSKIPGKLHIAQEYYYQSVVYMLLSLAGLKVELERWQSTGILDGVLELPGRVYLMEFKFARSGKPEAQAQRALETIAARRYPEAWADEPCIRIAWGLGIAGKTLAWSSRILE